MSYNPQVSRDGVTLRASTLALADGTYDATPAELRMQNWNQLMLFCTLTKDAGTTSAEIKVQVASPAGDDAPAAADWHDLAYQDTPAVASAVASLPMCSLVYRMTATGKLAIPVQCNYKWLRVAAKTTGAVGTTTLAIYATQGMA